MTRSRMTRGLALGTGALASGALIFAAAPAATAATTNGDAPASATARVGQLGGGPYLGARLVPSEDGATVARVVDGGPADVAGIAEGDIVLTIDGVSIDQRSSLRDALSSAEAGGDLAVVFTHDGAEESVVVTVGASADRPARPAAEDVAWVGARMVASEDSNGVIVRTVSADGPADAAGLVVGDVVTAIDDTPVTDWSQVCEILRGDAPGGSVKLTVDRDGSDQTLTVTLGSVADAGAPSGDGARPADGARADAKGDASDGSGRKGGGSERGAQRGDAGNADAPADALADAQSA